MTGADHLELGCCGRYNKEEGKKGSCLLGVLGGERFSKQGTWQLGLRKEFSRRQGRERRPTKGPAVGLPAASTLVQQAHGELLWALLLVGSWLGSSCEVARSSSG